MLHHLGQQTQCTFIWAAQTSRGSSFLCCLFFILICLFTLFFAPFTCMLSKNCSSPWDLGTHRQGQLSKQNVKPAAMHNIVVYCRNLFNCCCFLFSCTIETLLTFLGCSRLHLPSNVSYFLVFVYLFGVIMYMLLKLVKRKSIAWRYVKFMVNKCFFHDSFSKALLRSTKVNNSQKLEELL